MINDNEAILRAIDENASIKLKTFRIVCGLFFALAIVSVLGRAGIRIYSRRRPTLDDYFIVFAAICLTTSSALVGVHLQSIYVTRALIMDPGLAYKTHDPGAVQMATAFLVYVNVCITLAWTAIFAVKFSFLATFRHLVTFLNSMRRYYWFVVVFTTLSGVFVVSEQYILCPHFGESAGQCSHNFKRRSFYSLTEFVTGLDTATDLMIISIPILVLRQSSLRLGQKIAVASFTCLSIVMIIFAIIRVSAVPGVSASNNLYQLFWLYMETNLAVTMASLTGYRTMFIIQKEKKKYRDRVQNIFYSFRRRGHGMKIPDEEGYIFPANALPQVPKATLPRIPRATLTGVRTFIRGNNRTAVGMTRVVFSEKGTTITHSPS